MRSVLWIAVLSFSFLGCVPSGGGSSNNDEPMGGEGEGAEGEGEGEGELPPEAEGLLSIAVGPQRAQLSAGVPQQFNAVGQYDSGDVDITDKVTWASSDPSILSFEDPSKPGLATVHATGRVSITATLGEINGVLAIGSCYPDTYDGTIRLEFGHVMPPLAWDGAYTPDGNQILFSLEDVYCDEAAYGNYSILIFVVGAGWCGACSAFASRLNGEAPAIEQAGGLIVYLEIEDSNYELATSDFANEHLGRIIGNGPGIRVGDADGKIWGLEQPGVVRGANIASSLPTVFVVRRSDMSVIANQNVSNFSLPFVEIAQNPDRDWSNPAPPMFRSNCPDGADEASEPNDTPDQAKSLPAGETVSGGICAEGPDYYQVDASGDWRIDLGFSHAQGDLDVYVWNVADDTAAIGPDGQPVGSNGAADGESFTHSGPAVVRVEGYNGASATYELTLTEL